MPLVRKISISFLGSISNDMVIIAEFGLEVVNTTDLQSFFQTFVPAAIGTYPINVSIDGGILANGRFPLHVIYQHHVY